MRKLRVKTTTCEWMRRWSLILTIFTFIYFWVVTYPAAKSGIGFKDFSQAGWALWIFIILGAIIILLQLIPAILLFFNFIGTGTHALYEVVDKKKEEEEVTEGEKVQDV